MLNWLIIIMTTKFNQVCARSTTTEFQPNFTCFASGTRPPLFTLACETVFVVTTRASILTRCPFTFVDICSLGGGGEPTFLCSMYHVNLFKSILWIWYSFYNSIMFKICHSYWNMKFFRVEWIHAYAGFTLLLYKRFNISKTHCMIIIIMR